MEDQLKELMKDELFARGYEIRRQAFGDAVVDADAAVRMNDEFQRPMWQHGVQRRGDCCGRVPVSTPARAASQR